MRSPAEPIGGCGYMVNNEEGTVFEQTSTLWASEIAVGLRFQADVVGAFAGFETIVRCSETFRFARDGRPEGLH